MARTCTKLVTCVYLKKACILLIPGLTLLQIPTSFDKWYFSHCLWASRFLQHFPSWLFRVQI